MKFGFRVPSFKKKFAARTSLKRFARHSLGMKAPKGLGLLTNPKKAVYNKVYNKTTFSAGDLNKTQKTPDLTSADASGCISCCSKPVGCFVFAIMIISSLIMMFITNGTELMSFSVAFGIFSLAAAIIFFVAEDKLVKAYQNSPAVKGQQLINSGVELMKIEDYEKAIEYLEKAKELLPDNNSINRYLAGCYSGIEKFEIALDLMKTVYNNEPNDENTLLIGATYFEAKDYETAIGYLQKINESSIHFLKAIDFLGQSFVKKQTYQVAIETFKRAPLRKRNLDEDLMSIHYHLGEAYELNGDKKQSMKHYQKVYAIDRSFNNVWEKVENT